MGLLKLKVSEEEKNQKKSTEDLEETLRKLRLQKNQLIEIIQEKDQEIKKLRAKDEALRNRMAGCQEQSSSYLLVAGLRLIRLASSSAAIVSEFGVG